MKKQLLLPEKIKVGYQKRGDTYTGKLAYVIYQDVKGVWRKEPSWNGWRHDNINPDIFDNKPMEGFVLNKGVGGSRQSYGWNARNEYIRVYDPRGFEFEISVANLLYILQECTSAKGKGLEGEFIYSWEGKELVLLPVGSQEYKDSIEFTNLQDTKIGARDLKIGCPYMTKKMETFVYMGRFMFYTRKYDYTHREYKTVGKKGHVFYNEKSKRFFVLKTMGSLAKLLSDAPVSNYNTLMDDFNATKNSSLVKRLITKNFNAKFEVDDNYGDYKEKVYYMKNENTFYKIVFCKPTMDGYQEDYLRVNHYTKFTLCNGAIIIKHDDINSNENFFKGLVKQHVVEGNYYTTFYYYKKSDILKIPFYSVIAELENGSKSRLDKYEYWY